MSIQAVGWALDQELPAGPKLVLVAIANHANHADGYCWLHAETIAAEASCKPRSVYRFVAALMRNGFVRRERRRGADGKQRSNDYWILFNREPAKWDWGGAQDDPEAENEAAETHSSDDDDPLDVVANYGTESEQKPSMSLGQSDSDDTRQDPEKPSMSSGPTVVGVTHSITAEPSKTNPEESRARGAPPRHYQPPPPDPPQPVGSTDGNGPVFVYEGTRAYEAWAKLKARQNRINRWHLVRTKIVDGKPRSGWDFPTLFPPQAQPPPSELMTEEDAKELAKSG